MKKAAILKSYPHEVEEIFPADYSKLFRGDVLTIDNARSIRKKAFELLYKIPPNFNKSIQLSNLENKPIQCAFDKLSYLPFYINKGLYTMQSMNSKDTNILPTSNVWTMVKADKYDDLKNKTTEQFKLKKRIREGFKHEKLNIDIENTISLKKSIIELNKEKKESNEKFLQSSKSSIEFKKNYLEQLGDRALQIKNINIQQEVELISKIPLNEKQNAENNQLEKEVNYIISNNASLRNKILKENPLEISKLIQTKEQRSAEIDSIQLKAKEEIDIHNTALFHLKAICIFSKECATTIDKIKNLQDHINKLEPTTLALQNEAQVTKGFICNHTRNIGDFEKEIVDVNTANFELQAKLNEQTRKTAEEIEEHKKNIEINIAETRDIDRKLFPLLKQNAINDEEMKKEFDEFEGDSKDLFEALYLAAKTVIDKVNPVLSGISSTHFNLDEELKGHDILIKKENEGTKAN